MHDLEHREYKDKVSIACVTSEDKCPAVILTEQNIINMYQYYQGCQSYAKRRKSAPKY